MGKFCTTCGKELVEGMAFCVFCGTKVPRLQEQGALGSQPVGAQSDIPRTDFAAPAFELAQSYAPSFEEDSESDMAATEVWQVSVERNPSHADPFTVEVPKDEAEAFTAKPHPDFAFPAATTREVSSAGAEEAQGATSNVQPGGVLDVPLGVEEDDEEDCDESPTIVAFLPIEDDEEDESPTIVVARERYILVRDEDGQRVEIIPPCILGRGKAADKKVKGNQAISRKHAKVFLEDNLVMVQDLESTNGTFVNGVELEGDQCEPLSDGASLRLGTEDFTFRIEMR